MVILGRAKQDLQNPEVCDPRLGVHSQQTLIPDEKESTFKLCHLPLSPLEVIHCHLVILQIIISGYHAMVYLDVVE